jgi:hypothetical protein
VLLAHEFRKASLVRTEALNRSQNRPLLMHEVSGNVRQQQTQVFCHLTQGAKIGDRFGIGSQRVESGTHVFDFKAQHFVFAMIASGVVGY